MQLDTDALKLKIVQIFNEYCSMELIYKQDDDVFEDELIEEFSKKYRTTIKVKVWFEKDKYGNPYYYSGKKLYDCTQFINKLYSYDWGHEILSDVICILNKLCELKAEDKDYNSIDNRINYLYENSEEYLKNIVYYLTNNIVIITRWAGGYNSNIESDCEFEAYLSLFNSISEESVGKVMDDLCQEYNASWAFL